MNSVTSIQMTEQDLADALKGQRVLLVEDDPLITAVIVDLMESRKIDVFGPAATLGSGMEFARAQAFDAAVLDVNLGAETSFAIADVLKEKGVPFFFTTSADNRWHPKVVGQDFLAKPYGAKSFLQMLAKTLGNSMSGC